MKIVKNFASDNNSGIHPDVLQAITNVNIGHTIAYGDDIYTEAAIRKFKEHFGEEIDVYFVFNGTGANVLGLRTIAESYNAVICAETAHINVDECGAPEKFVGCKLLTAPTLDGKITVEQIKPFLHSVGFEHHSQPKVISITQSTELGTVYTPGEIKELADFAHANDMFLHMDGARIANAAVSLGVDLYEITGKAGVDVLSFGGTKNGIMLGEAVVFFNRNFAKNFKYIRKQGMQLASKMRFVAAQFQALLSNNLWRNNASNANAMACLLAEKLEKNKQIRITQKVEANAVFATIPKNCIELLQEKYFFYVWDEAKSEVRWVTSFDTTEADVHDFVQVINEVTSSKDW